MAAPKLTVRAPMPGYGEEPSKVTFIFCKELRVSRCNSHEEIYILLAMMLNPPLKMDDKSKVTGKQELKK